MVFVLAALTVVAAGSLGLLVRTIKYVQKKPRRRSPHSPCPWLGPFFVDRARCWRFLSRGHFNLAKGFEVKSEGKSGGGARQEKKTEKSEKRATREKGREEKKKEKKERRHRRRQGEM